MSPRSQPVRVIFVIFVREFEYIFRIKVIRSVRVSFDLE